MDDRDKLNLTLGINSIGIILWLGMAVLIAHVTDSWQDAGVVAFATWIGIGSVAYLAARMRYGWKKDAKLSNIFLLMAAGTVTVSVILVYGRAWPRRPQLTREEGK